MNYKACDELGSNLLDAQTQWACALDHTTAEELIDAICKRYGQMSMELLMDDELDKLGVEGNERHGYKMALGLFFGNRAQVRIIERREAFKRPSPPIEAYEQ